MQNEEPPEVWQAELWKYLDTGNGNACPLRDYCEICRNGGWCISDHREAQTAQSKYYDTRAKANFRNLFPDRWTPGLIFHLVEKLAASYREKIAAPKLSAPTDIFKQAKVPVPVEVRFVPLKAYHGAVWRLTDGWVIHLNSNDPTTRQRETAEKVSLSDYRK